MDLTVVAEIAGALGISVRELWHAIKRTADSHRKSKADEDLLEFLGASSRFSSEGWGVEFTKRYYGATALRGLHRYAININGSLLTSSLATSANWTGTRVLLASEHEDCTVVAPPPQVALATDDEVANIFADLQERKLKIWNAPIFRLVSLELNEHDLHAGFCIDDFFRYRFTSGALHDELIRALVKTDFDIEAMLDRRFELLPMREKHLPTSQRLSDFGARIAACGINVMTAIARPAPWRDYAIILQRRGKYVSNRQGSLTVLPGGHHQPTVEPKTEVALSRTVLRELFEEVFGGQEAQRDCTRLCVDWYESVSEPMKWLRKHRGAFDLRITGVGISMITGSVNFAVALVINDESFWCDYAHELRTNWEVADNITPILSTRDPNIGAILKDPQWTDYALYSLAEGLFFLQQTASERMSPLTITRPH